MEEVTVSRSLLQEDKRKTNVQLPDTTPTIQDVLDRLDVDAYGSEIENFQVETNNPTEKQNTDALNDKEICEAPLDEDKQMDDEDQTFSKSKENTDASNDSEICEPLFHEDKQKDDVDPDFLKSGFTGDLHIETVTDRGIIRRLKRFFGVTKKIKEVKVSITKEDFFLKSKAVRKKHLLRKKIAPIIIWDLGGQDVFCSIHQKFLTYRAIYMIVLDGSRTLDDPCPYEQYIQGKIAHKTTRGIYIDSLFFL